MSRIVFDSSTLLALINQENGHEIALKYLPDAIMSTVNISEVLAVLTSLKIPEAQAKETILDLVSEIVPFELQHALITGAIRKDTQQYGLSLGDRACLALAKSKNLPVLTADKIWAKVEINIKIILLR